MDGPGRPRGDKEEGADAADAEPRHAEPSGATARKALSTLYYPRREAWMAHVQALDASVYSTPWLLARLLAWAPSFDALVLDGASHREELAGLLLLARPRSPTLIFAEATWGLSGSALDRWISRLLVWMFARRDVYLCVLSTYELESYPRVWGFRPERLFYTPFYATLDDEELAVPHYGGDGVFAGGDSLRDYAPLVSAAAELPSINFTIATGLLSGADVSALPPNVAAGRIPHEQFARELREASVVVVPFEQGIERSAGQQTYLNAMALGKIAIVTDGPGVGDYIEHGSTGLIVEPGDPRQLVEAIRWATDPRNEADQRRMRERAREVVLQRFMPANYADSLVSVLDQVLTRGRSDPERAASLSCDYPPSRVTAMNRQESTSPDR